MKKTSCTILLVDDHQLVLDGLTRILSAINGIDTVTAVNNSAEAITHPLLKENTLLITDIEMPGINGIELLKKVKESHPSVKVLIVSMYNNAQLAKEIIRLKADGYILKSAGEKELEFAIQEIISGKKYFSYDVTLELASTEINPGNSKSVLNELTQREKEILGLIAQGFSNKQIAEKLFVAVKTIDSHRTNLMNKLDIHNVAGLTRFAIQNNLL